MSHVSLLAADRPMPLQEAAGVRRRTVSMPSGEVTVTEDGFSVQEHVYYRFAVDNLAFEMKPYRYELDLRCTEEDVRCLKEYLEGSCEPGEQVELWNLWVGDGPDRPIHYTGLLADLDLNTLLQWEERQQTCMTIQR